VASPAVKKGGMVHFYTFKKPHQIEGLAKSYENRVLRLCSTADAAMWRLAFAGGPSI